MSDIARVYAPGTEPARAGTGGLPAAPGKEIATVANGHNAHDYKDDRAR